MSSTLGILVTQFIAWCMTIVPKLLGALIVFLVGKILIGKAIDILNKNHTIAKLDGSVRSFSLSAIKAALYVILFVTIINIMGVPMASVVAVIASAGVAVGLALQGALSNLAGGIMLVIWVLKPANVWVFSGLQAVAWLGLGVFSMVSWALITDVIDYSELKNGVREDGSVYALDSFARKLGQALAAGLSGWLLEAIGYNSKAAEQGLAQTESVLDGIFNITTLLPALGFVLLALVLWFWYPLHKKQVDANVAALKEKRGE